MTGGLEQGMGQAEGRMRQESPQQLCMLGPTCSLLGLPLSLIGLNANQSVGIGLRRLTRDQAVKGEVSKECLDIPLLCCLVPNQPTACSAGCDDSTVCCGPAGLSVYVQFSCYPGT